MSSLPNCLFGYLQTAQIYLENNIFQCVFPSNIGEKNPVIIENKLVFIAYVFHKCKHVISDCLHLSGMCTSGCVSGCVSGCEWGCHIIICRAGM